MPVRVAFVDPAANVEAIRFPEREPLNMGDIAHLGPVSALCGPLYDETEDRLSCDRCVESDDFSYPLPTLTPSATRGSGSWQMHQIFEGSFAGPGHRQAILISEGCEWRKGGLTISTHTEQGWMAGEYLEGVPFDSNSKCLVAKSPAWGDMLVCEGTLITNSVGMRKMRGSHPYGWAVAAVRARDNIS